MKVRVCIRKVMRSGSGVFLLDSCFSSEDDFMVIFGPSGSGKTLTLRAIAGLITPDEGNVSIGDRVLFDSESGINLPARERRIGYVFQDYALFPHLTVRENVEFGLKRKLRIAPEDAIRTTELLDSMGLAHLAGNHPRELSGGECQRVALARALARRPDLLLLDEPFAALDTSLRARLRKELLNTHARFPIPIIMITHDPEDVDALARTVINYDRGRVAGIDSLDSRKILRPAFNARG